MGTPTAQQAQVLNLWSAPVSDYIVIKKISPFLEGSVTFNTKSQEICGFSIHLFCVFVTCRSKEQEEHIMKIL